MPVNALSAGESNTEQQTLDDLNTENSNSTNESNATSAEVATDSNASEDTSISDISSNDIDSSEEKMNNEISLQSDNTEEDGEEPSTDNWELGLVFYDSTVDNGKTPLTEINWDASDGEYGDGTPRVITLQVNYKNTNAVTTYQPGDVEIKIPNLMYSKDSNSWSNYANNYEVQTKVSLLVGANDATHDGYNWDFKMQDTNKDDFNKYYTCGHEYITFTNTNVIEEKSNFEGSIKMDYTITPMEEYSSYLEPGEDECTHSLSKHLKAILITKPRDNSEDVCIESPNYPKTCPNNMTEDKDYWEYCFESAKGIFIKFSEDTVAYEEDVIKIYDKDGNIVIDTTNTNGLLRGKTIRIYGNNLKVTMKSGSGYHIGKFAATISPIYDTAESNEIDFKYIRTYIHPWKREAPTIKKSVGNPLSSYDGFGDDASNYIWVPYIFEYRKAHYNNYPFIAISEWKVYDTFPESCKVYSYTGEPLESEDGIYTLTSKNAYQTSYGADRVYLQIYVGYLKSQYYDSMGNIIEENLSENEYVNENGNLIIKNTGDLYGTYKDRTVEEFFDSDTVEISLSDFELHYSGNLYGISKKTSSNLRYQDILAEDGYYTAEYTLHPIAYYTGDSMTVRFGDDLLYATKKDKGYQKLEDTEYYFSKITFPLLYNGNNHQIAKGKYNCELWVRYAGKSEYELYDSFTNGNKGEVRYSGYSWNFKKEKQVVGYYFLIKDMKESLISGAYDSHKCVVNFIMKDIPESGTVYNFDYIQVYFKDENGNLVLQNEPDASSYGNIFTYDNIAKYDLDTYGTYMQRGIANNDWVYYRVPKIENRLFTYKTASEITQDAQNELFKGSFNIYSLTSLTPQFNTKYLEQYSEESTVKGFLLYDLVPEGIKVTSTEEEIQKSLYLVDDNHSSSKDPSSMMYYINDSFEEQKNHSWHGGYTVCDLSGKRYTFREIYEILKNNIKVEVIENWRNTGRTLIKAKVDISDIPLIFGEDAWVDYYSMGFAITYNYEISYDSYLEYGKLYRNYVYSEFLEPSSTQFLEYSRKRKDDGYYDKEAIDINENGSQTDELSYAYANITINSIVSSHQDVQTQVQTVNDNFTVGKGTSPYNEEYTYKLRVRTGQNAATNMVIANNLEMAYGNKKFWQGEFKGIDTSYIENKTWMVYDPKNENANSDGYVPKKIVVKPYYSTDPEETDLYLTEQTIVEEDGKEVSKTIFREDENGNILKNSNWKEYNDSIDKNTVKSLAFELLDADTNKPAVIPANSLLYVLVKLQAPVDPYEGDDTIDQSKRPLSKDIKTYAYNNCWTQWNPIDETFNTKVDFVTGIHSNIVRVALPYTVEDEALINLRFIKAIEGTDEAFDKMKLKKDNAYKFHITLTNQETGDIIQGILDSKTGLQIKEIPIGTYLIKESDDMYFDFVDMVADIVDGITFDNTDDGYILSIDNTISEDTTFEIIVNNKIEPDRPYEDKKERVNLFDWTSDENTEEASLLSRVMNFFTN